MTDEDRAFIENPGHSTRARAERMFENLRRVEINLSHFEKFKDVPHEGVELVRDDDECPTDIAEAAGRSGGTSGPVREGRPAALQITGRFIPPLLLMAVIFDFSAQPDLNSGLGDWDTVGRKLIHAASYGTLWFLWVARSRLRPRRRGGRHHAALRGQRRVPPDLHRRAATARPSTC